MAESAIRETAESLRRQVRESVSEDERGLITAAVDLLEHGIMALERIAKALERRAES